MKYPKRSQYKHAKQKKYRIRNWAEYNGALRRRGDLTLWFSEEAIIGAEMRARTLARQRVEHRIGCEILNKMTDLGMPDANCVG